MARRAFASAALAILLAALLRAVDSDFRAGLWEGTLERGRGIERIVLLLTISVEGMGSPHAATSALAQVESSSGVCGSSKAAIEPNRVSFDCMTIGERGAVESSAGYFDGYFSPRSNLITGTWRPQTIRFACVPGGLDCRKRRADVCGALIRWLSHRFSSQRRPRNHRYLL